MLGAALCSIICRKKRHMMGTTAMGLVEKAQANAPAAPVAELERFRLRRFVEGLDEDLDTVHAAIRPRRCGGIVLALDALRSKGLDRDGEGRYFIKPK
jgi:hypothetical protein